MTTHSEIDMLAQCRIEARDQDSEGNKSLNDDARMKYEIRDKKCLFLGWRLGFGRRTVDFEITRRDQNRFRDEYQDEELPKA